MESGEEVIVLPQQVLLQCRGMSKSFGQTKAVVEVDLQIRRGEIRGLIGENGSGKSTLCSMITGMLKPDRGSMEWCGKNFAPSSLIESKAEGISILLQETGTIAGLSVAENMFIGKEGQFVRRGVVSRREMERRAGEMLAQVSPEIRPEDPIERYSFEQRKLVEVARALGDGPKLLIVDETTTALSQTGRERIYKIIRRMKDEGKSVIFITHDLQELMQVCDSVTVLRDGHYVDTLSCQGLTEDRVRQLMIGRDLSGHYYRLDRESRCGAPPVLHVRDLVYGRAVRGVSFELHEGEILGVGGLTDCGMHELGKLIFGACRADGGTVRVAGREQPIANTAQAMEAGIALIPKDRDTESIFLAASIGENITITCLDQLTRFGLISKRKERALAQREAERLSVKMQGIGQYVKDLSGGNKQKVAIAKWLANRSRILVMDCPTRGIDIGVKAAIYALMEQLQAEGCSIIMISEELPELIGMADRLLIMKDGRINGTFLRAEGLSERDIVGKMI